MTSEVFSFVIYMIHACANRWDSTPVKVYHDMKETGCIDHFLMPHYEILHTQSSDYVVTDIQEYLKLRGVAV